MSIYEEKGYKSREDYLENLAEEYGVDFEVVESISSIYGEEEDFDGLVTAIQDFTDDLY